MRTTLSTPDSRLWLEEVEGRKALEWVSEKNKVSQKHFQEDARYNETFENIKKVLLDDQKIAYPTLVGNDVYNFWDDATNPRGIWRKTSLRSYLSGNPRWEVLLDIDKLGKDEGKSWVYKGATCLEPTRERCLVSLSEGGTDSVEVREFDLPSKTFLQINAFNTKNAKQILSWIDKDTVLISTDFGPGSMTDSGYARIVKVWKRGTALAEAQTLIEVPKTDMRAYGWTSHNPDAQHSFITQSPTFWTSKHFLVLKDFTLKAIPIPEDVKVYGVFKNHFLFSNRSDWNSEGKTFPQGSLIAYNLNFNSAPKLVFKPTQNEVLSGLSYTQDHLLVLTLKDVLHQLNKYTLRNNTFRKSPSALPKDGSLSLVSADNFSNKFFASYESFLTPTQLYYSNNNRLKVVRTAPKNFDSSPYTFSQKWAASSDGTKIPYFLIHRKDMVLEGENPTLLYAYGGFEIPLTASYLNFYGSTWLDKGGVYAVANIRGGGEFGPQWHQAALRDKRQVAFDDFYAVSESLIENKITKSKKLGIRGGSNGGLLMGAAITQRPELYNAVLCLVPLLDMLRYHKLLAGASWMAEYGNPDIAQDAEFLKKLSPYHNLSKEKTYPKVYFSTSTKDDRVHPAHARKMVSAMEDLGHEVLYYENPEGGHAAAADPLQRARTRAYELVYLYQQLMD